MTLSTRRRRDRERCRNARVWLDGVEITADCFYVDARRGVVRLYARNAEGKHHLDSDPRPPTAESRVATEERHGRVRLQVTA